jgi:hypothetical protein
MANSSNPAGAAFAQARVVPVRPVSSGRTVKLAVWAIMALMTLSVLFLSELPLLRAGTATRAHILDIRWLLLPHVAGASLALTTGAVQFSSRIRRWSLTFHRITGRVYVGSIFVAGPVAIVMSHGTIFFTATIVQAGAWMVTALAALLTARNRQIEQHRQWVVRSYAVTFSFILLHVLNPLGIWTYFSESEYATAIIICTFLAVLVPDVAFNWRQSTHKRG